VLGDSWPSLRATAPPAAARTQRLEHRDAAVLVEIAVVAVGERLHEELGEACLIPLGVGLRRRDDDPVVGERGGDPPLPALAVFTNVTL
jgi:hypothetical protein